ncbi:unnamed protein product [Rhizophagus irregularis]|uniref:Protein kinase domain-containing protein n=1 Tax=Rhizophagus irregularis TaxID=588596 RepID=A0A915ZU25_9GLOM|nr:unnamed protein product [Rhizophagus irregularis]
MKIHDVLDDVITYNLEIHSKIIGSGGSALVQVAYWNNTQTKFAVKRFNESFKKEEIINEIKITKIASQHPNIIRFYGVTRSQDKSNYSLVLEYADGGTLGNYLRANTETFKWESQLQFAKEIASAVSWLHDNRIIHGDINPKNILIHKQEIKLADLDVHVYKEINLALVFWELTSHRSPFDYETKKNGSEIMLEIHNGKREKPMSNTNGKFVALYQKCWKCEPNDRPNICEVISKLNSVYSTNSENNEESTDFDSKGSEKIESTKELEGQDMSKYNINSSEYSHLQ